MKRLIIGSIPENFNVKHDIPISPACFLGKENIYPQFESLNYVHINEGKKIHPTLDEILNNEALFFASKLSEHFFPLDSKNYTFRFWKSIYYPFLSLTIPYIYTQKLLIEKVVEIYNNEEIHVEVNRKYLNNNFKFCTPSELIERGLNNLEFYEFVNYFLLENLLPQSWSISYYDEVTKNITNSKPKKRIKLSNLGFKYFDTIFFRAKQSYGFTFFDRILFHFLFTIKKPIKNFHYKEIHAPVNNSINWNFDVFSLLIALTPKSLTTKELLIPKRKFKKGKLVSYSNELYGKSSKEAAFSYLFKEIVISDQHGGHLYGSGKSSESVKNIEFEADYFISWGWNIYKNKRLDNVIKLPSPLLSKYYNKNTPVNNYHIFVGTNMSLVKNNFNGGLTPVETLEYRKNKKHFISAYQNNFDIVDLYYKPYRETNFSLSDSSYLLKSFPDLNILNNGKKDFHQIMLTSSLLILDHPGTTLNIAFSMNIHVLLMWKKEWFSFNDNSEVFLNKFEELGVFYETPDELIAGMKNIVGTFQEYRNWWNQDIIQQLRLSWLKEYGLTDKNWRLNWIKAFWQLK